MFKSLLSRSLSDYAGNVYSSVHPGMRRRITSSSRFSFLTLVIALITYPEASLCHAAGPGRTRTIALTGDIAPGGNGILSRLGDPVLNGSGVIAFPAALTATSHAAADDKAIFMFNGDTLAEIVREGQSAPDGDGTFDDSTFGSFLPGVSFFGSSVTINDAGQVAFDASFTGASSGLLSESAIVRFQDGVLSQLVRQGDAAPGGNGIFGPLGFKTDFNESGEVVFIPLLLDATGAILDAGGVFRADETGVTAVVRGPRPAPDGNGILRGFSTARMNDFAPVAFFGFLRSTAEGATDDSGIFLATHGDVVQLVREGQAVPNGNGRFSGAPLTQSDFIRRLAFNNHGQLTFMAGISDTIGGSADDRGVFRIDGTEITELLRKGDPAPDGNGTFDDFDLNGGIYLNETGQVAFVATLANTEGGTQDDIGIFLVEGSTVIQLVREGQRAPRGGTFFGLNMNTFGELTEGGQVAFLAGIKDETGAASFGIFLASPQGIVEVIREGQHLAGSTVARLAFVFPPSHFDIEERLRSTGRPKRFTKFGQVVYRATLSDGREGIFLFSVQRPQMRDGHRMGTDALENDTAGRHRRH